MKPIIVRGNLGYFEDDPRLRDAERKRERYHSDPDYRAHKLAVAARWHAEHRERRRAYNREYMRRWRASSTVSNASRPMTASVRCCG